ncbi:DUF4145 domain-containing protein [Planotetraspora sp. A-T 1434]|uniref:DUF4145 domain-containing protein n=1 Tax=Planotetraspora sp. A-T 1434 TaxID=2979219 RepID=UPI0021C1676B|nr:DUF4145 domain-containing protein [Planotetraspora sp. A-T 1434]MCT9931812.1 DUF4145 domain-containing protein [Planotetraspora sp. A-T 1434]
MQQKPTTFRFILPLEVAAIISSQLLGTTTNIILKNLNGTLSLPIKRRNPDQGGGPTLAPPLGFERASNCMPNRKSWGDWTTYSPTNPENFQVSIEALAFTITTDDWTGEMRSDFSDHIASAPDELKSELQDWVKRFCSWTQLIVNQPLDLTDPIPGVIARPSEQMLSWAELEGSRSKIDSSAGPLSIEVAERANPLSERLIEEGEFARIVELTNNPTITAPMAVTLHGAAQLAAQRRKWRQAISEIGTAVEAIYTELLGLPTNHKKTLGALLKTAEDASISIPTGTKEKILNPRNSAVHQGIPPSQNTVLDAIEILAGLIRTHHPGWIGGESLAAVHRPYQHDLSIVIT